MAGRRDDGSSCVTITADGRCVRLSGTLSHDTAGTLRKKLDRWRPAGAVELDLTELEITDASGVLASVDAIRALAAARERIVIRGAPLLLGHNLYRAGLLERDSGLELVAMREDEPYG